MYGFFVCLFVSCFCFWIKDFKMGNISWKVKQTKTKIQQYLPEQFQGSYNTKQYKGILTEYRYNNSLEMLLKILPALTLCPWRYVGVCLLLLCLISVFLFKLFRNLVCQQSSIIWMIFLFLLQSARKHIHKSRLALSTGIQII